MWGDPGLATYEAIIAFDDRLKASPNPRNRPLSVDSFVRQIFIVHAVATLKALDPRRKIRGDIAKQVAKYYGVSETWVFEARKSVDPQMRAIIEGHAVRDMNHALHFADPSAAQKWRRRERRRTDDLTGLESFERF
jgi:hypothetical protein